MKFQGVLYPLSPLPLSLTLSPSLSFFPCPSPSLSHMHMHTHMYLHIHKQPLHTYTFLSLSFYLLPITLHASHILSSPLVFTGKEMSPKLPSLLLSRPPVLLRAQASQP